MSTREHRIDEDEFHAFVDGHLPPERRRAVMAYLAACPDEAERLGAYRNVNESLHLLYDEVLHEPLPDRLKVERYAGGPGVWERIQRWFDPGTYGLVPRLAGIAALLAASAAGGWWMHAHYFRPAVETPAMAFARHAATAHQLFAPDVRHPVEFGADQQDSLLRWLSERLGHPVHAPSLQEIGYALVGGRLLPSAGQAAAQLMYETPDAKRITLYIRGRWEATPPIAGAQEGSVSYATESSVSMVYWIEGPFAYALIGQMDREQLFATAKTIQQQLQMPSIPSPSAEQTADKNAT